MIEQCPQCGSARFDTRGMTATNRRACTHPWHSAGIERLRNLELALSLLPTETELESWRASAVADAVRRARETAGFPRGTSATGQQEEDHA